MIAYTVVGTDRTVVLRAHEGLIEIEKLDEGRHLRTDIRQSQRSTGHHGDLATEDQELNPGCVDLGDLGEIQLDCGIRCAKHRQQPAFLFARRIDGQITLDYMLQHRAGMATVSCVVGGRCFGAAFVFDSDRRM